MAVIVSHSMIIIPKEILDESKRPPTLEAHIEGMLLSLEGAFVVPQFVKVVSLDDQIQSIKGKHYMVRLWLLLMFAEDADSEFGRVKGVIDIIQNDKGETFSYDLRTIEDKIQEHIKNNEKRIQKNPVQPEQGHS